MEETTNPGTEVNDSNIPDANDDALNDIDLDSDIDQLDDDPDADPDAELEALDEDVEYEGKNYKVPKELKEALLRQADYTRKTQEVAESRKAVEAQHEEFQRHVEVQRQNFAEYTEAYVLDNQLKEYAKIDWQALIDADPQQAMKLDRQMRETQQRLGEIGQSITQKQQQQALQEQQETAKRMQEGRAVLEREIKGWQPGNELDIALDTYAKAHGVKNPGPAIVGNPKLGVLLHKSYQFDQLMQKRAEKSKPEPQDKPVTRVTASKGTATKDPSRMSDAEFAALRKRQIAQRR